MSVNPPINPPTFEVPPPPEPPEAQGGFTRWLLIGLVGVIVTILVLFGIAILGGLSDSAGVSQFFRILRDFFIIVLALQGIVICLALIILVVQLTALINLLRSEIRPIVDDTRETLSTARGTAEFVGKNVAEPIIKVAATTAGARAFVSELLGIRRNLIGRGK